jgi:hypothetical protein
MPILDQTKDRSYVILSFDDGRKDNYDVAYSLLKQYGFTASFHITTAFVDGTIKNNYFNNIEAMSINDVIDMSNNGFDISSHGDMHINEKNDLKNSLLKLKKWGISSSNPIIFSSPNSEIYEKNIVQYFDMLSENRVKYLRSGIVVRRNGLLYCLIYLVQKLFNSKTLFYFLNRREIMRIDKKDFIIKSISVKKWNSIKQINYFIGKLKDKEIAVFLFHGIMYEKNNDDWCFSAEKFECFLKTLRLYKDRIKVLNIRQYTEDNIE